MSSCSHDLALLLPVLLKSWIWEYSIPRINFHIYIINCNDWAPCVTLLHVMRSLTPFPTVYESALSLLDCLKFVHKSRKGGWWVENPCTFLIGKISQATLKVIKRWWKIKASVMACIPFSSKWIVYTKLSYLNLRNFLLSHQIAVLFYLTLGEMLKNNYMRKLHLLHKLVWFWRCECRWLKWDWMVNQLQSRFMGKLLLRFPQPGTFSDFQS